MEGYFHTLPVDLAVASPNVRSGVSAAAPGGLRGGAAAEEPKAVGGLGGAVSCRRVGWWYGKLSDTIVKNIYIIYIYTYISSSF